MTSTEYAQLCIYIVPTCRHQDSIYAFAKKGKSVYICLVNMDPGSCPMQMLQRDESGERGVLHWEQAVCQIISPEQVSGNMNKDNGLQTTEIYPKEMKILLHSVSVLCIISYNSLKIGNLEMSYTVAFS